MALLLSSLVLAASLLCVQEIRVNRIAATPAFQIRFLEDCACLDQTSFMRMVKTASSGQRVVDYNVLERKARYSLSKEDREVLLRIVEAEAGNEDITGKMLVAGVVMNRVESGKFPDTVKEVVYQREDGVAQFSPVSNGRLEKVCVSEETQEAVERVIYGEDITKGALYFASRKYADPEKMKWFDNSLTLLFTYGGHEFFS